MSQLIVIQQALPQQACSFLAWSVVDSVADVHSCATHFHVHSQLPNSSRKRWFPCPSEPQYIYLGSVFSNHNVCFMGSETTSLRMLCLTSQRWYTDGTVKCFNGGHAPLGLLAIFTLAVCLAIIPLSLAYITAKLRVSM